MTNRKGKVVAVTNFIFLGSKITADGDCSHKIKTHLLLGRMAMTNLKSILTSKDITFPTKVPVDVRVGTIKKAECPRIDAFKLCCWKRLLRVLWTAGRSNQSILKDINPEYSLESLMLKLKLQYFDHMMPRADSLEKTLMLGRLKAKEEGGAEDKMVR